MTPIGTLARRVIRNLIEAQDDPRERAAWEWFDLCVRYGLVRDKR